MVFNGFRWMAIAILAGALGACNRVCCNPCDGGGEGPCVTPPTPALFLDAKDVAPRPPPTFGHVRLIKPHPDTYTVEVFRSPKENADPAQIVNINNGNPDQWFAVPLQSFESGKLHAWDAAVGFAVQKTVYVRAIHDPPNPALDRFAIWNVTLSQHDAKSIVDFTVILDADPNNPNTPRIRSGIVYAKQNTVSWDFMSDL